MENESRLFHQLGVLEGKLDATLAGLSRIERQQDDHEARITSLEHTRAQGTGVFAALRWQYVLLSAAVGTAFPFLLKVLPHAQGN